MKFFKLLFCLSVASSVTFAKGGNPDAICVSDNGVEVTIEKLGYDSQSALFRAKIKEDGKVVRNSTMRPTLISNGFSLYALDKNGDQDWVFDVTSRRSALIADRTSYLSIAKRLDDGVVLKCDRNLPLVYWRK